MCFFDLDVSSVVIGGIELEETIIERCFTVQGKAASFMIPTNVETIDPVMLVGVYKSGNDFYLCLYPNENSATIESMYESNVFPNFGIVSLTDEQYCFFVRELSNMGRDILDVSFENFDKMLNAIVSIIPCKVSFEVLFNNNGYFDSKTKSITIAKNQSQFSILFTILHEYMHYILNDRKSIPPDTIEEYIFDREENLCNLVSYKVLEHFFKSYVDAIFNTNNIYSIKKSDWNSFIKGTIAMILVDEEDFVTALSNEIIRSIEKEYYNEKINIDKFKLNGCVVLSIEDNKRLYELIMNDISPLISYDI